MSERERYQPGVPCWVDTAQPDPEAATRFYGDLFDWEFIGPGPMPGVPPGRYFVARVRGRDVAGVSSQPQGGSPAPMWNMYVSVKSADKTAAKVAKGGGTVMVSPFDALPAGRMAVLRDPAGAAFCAWEARERQGAQLVNEPRAWAMNSLSTPDPDACTAFYGTVFGWKTDRFGRIGSAITSGGFPVTLEVNPASLFRVTSSQSWYPPAATWPRTGAWISGWMMPMRLLSGRLSSAGRLSCPRTMSPASATQFFKTRRERFFQSAS
jgi:predicted enzyme related to lactoylglutathione lyase